jgi:hypothetical protein
LFFIKEGFSKIKPTPPPPPPHNTRYGKSIFDILSVKENFFTENEILLAENKRIADIYKHQPLRTNCKLCGNAMHSDIFLRSHEINYFLCDKCGHLNGAYQDTIEFTEKIYSDQRYAKNYSALSLENYLARLDSIYMPKADFLINCLRSSNIDYKKWKFLDVGAGSGYMVGALRRKGLAAEGIEVSTQQVALGNRMLGGNFLSAIAQDKTDKIVASTSAEICMFIGVLEHLYDLTAMLKNIKNNTAIQYIYFSVPMFSLSCILESVFPEVFNRQLGGGHTHLFTRDSLEWLYTAYDFSPQAEWNFGTDIMDLYRSITVMLEKQNLPNRNLTRVVSNIFQENTDGIQYILDRSGFCSETHILAKVNHTQI